MKKTDITKVLIRIVGAACIIGAMVMLFLSPWVEMDGLKRKEKNAVIETIQEISVETEEFALELIEDDDLDDFWRDLKDEGLPYNSRTIKRMVQDLFDPLEAIFDDGLTMKGIFDLSRALPDALGWTDVALDLVLDSPRSFGVYNNDVDSLEDIQDSLSVPVPICRGVFIAFLLLAVLALGAAVGHVCNHARWAKYILLIIVLALVVGCYVAVPMVSDMMADGMEEIVESAYTLGLTTKQAATIALLVDLELKATVMPGLAAGLMLVPVVLDIIFERKKARA